MEAQRDQPPAVTNHIRSLEEQFRNLLGLKVDIRPLAHGAGMVIVHFHSNDEFEQILRKLRRTAA